MVKLILMPNHRACSGSNHSLPFAKYHGRSAGTKSLGGSLLMRMIRLIRGNLTIESFSENPWSSVD